MREGLQQGGSDNRPVSSPELDHDPLLHVLPGRPMCATVVHIEVCDPDAASTQ